MSVGYEVSSRFEVNGQPQPFIPLTPMEERPFVAHALRVACDYFSPNMHENVDYLENMQRRLDNSGGRDRQAALAVSRISGLLWRGISHATSHMGIRESWEPNLPADAERGMPGTYDVPPEPGRN